MSSAGNITLILAFAEILTLGCKLKLISDFVESAVDIV